MSITPEQLEEEKKYLKKTLAAIQSLIDKSDISVQTRIDSINELKRYIWENNAMLDEAEIASEMYNVNSDVNRTNENIKELQKYYRLKILR